MHAVLSENIKRRFIQELQEYWGQHPKYRDSLIIQGRYSFDERPQQAIILKNASANPFQLSADHYQGVVVSYCHLTGVYGKPGTALEWVREDRRAVQGNGGEFPSPAGIYYIEVRQEGVDWNNVPGGYGGADCPPPGPDSGPVGTGQSYGMCFYVDPLLSVIDERPLPQDPTHYQVAQGKFHDGSLQVFEMPGNIPMFDGITYEADPTTGVITLARPLATGTHLSVDYYYAGTSQGPFPIADNTANNTAIPGVVLAFGRLLQDGDVMAVVVSERREDAAREFGGRWTMSLDFDLMARDVHAQEELTDRTLMFLHAQLRDRLSFEGIEIVDVSSGGEAEEQYDEVGDDYFYTASISVSLETEWAMHLPLDRTFTRILPNTVEQLQAVTALTDEQIAETGNPTLLLVAENLNLVQIRDPWFSDRSRNWELIR